MWFVIYSAAIKINLDKTTHLFPVCSQRHAQLDTLPIIFEFLCQSILITAAVEAAVLVNTLNLFGAFIVYSSEM